MNLFFYPDDSGNTGNLNFDFMFQVFLSCKDRKQIRSFVFWEKLGLDNFLLQSTDQGSRFFFRKSGEISLLVYSITYYILT